MRAEHAYDPAGDDALRRYARQIALPEIGAEGQARLARSKALIVGLGGLGSPAAFYLASAGVGTLGLMDGDRVDAGNLQRQILHTTEAIGSLKVESAQQRLSALNPHVRLIPYAERLSPERAVGIMQDYDIVIEATDNFASKYLVADACHATNTPVVHAGIDAYQGQLLTVLPGRTACYRCVFGEAPSDNPTPRGPLGVVAGVLGLLQATEALKDLLGLGERLTGRLLLYDALGPTFRILHVDRNPDCALCARDGNALK